MMLVLSPEYWGARERFELGQIRQNRGKKVSVTKVMGSWRNKQSWKLIILNRRETQFTSKYTRDKQT